MAMIATMAFADAQTTQNAQTTPITGGTVTLVPLNKQGAGGSAVLTQQGSGVKVHIDLPNAASNAAAELYTGSCSSNAQPQIKGPAQSLGTISNGSAESVIPNTTIQKLISPDHAIVVRSGSGFCGDLGTLLSPQRP